METSPMMYLLLSVTSRLVFMIKKKVKKFVEDCQPVRLLELGVCPRRPSSPGIHK